MPVWSLLIIAFLPVLGGFIIGQLKVKDGIRKLLSYIVVVITSVLTWLAIFNVNEGNFLILEIVSKYTIELKFDNLGKIFAGMVSILWPLALMYSYGYMKHDNRRSAYNTFYVMTFGIVLGLAFSANLLTMFCFYEMLTFITLPLIVHPGTSEARRAGRFYLYFSLSGSSLSLVGMIMITSFLGTNSFDLAFASMESANFIYYIGYILCFFGFGVKSAIFPVHFWLPMAGAAPTPTTALLHAVAVVKAGLFALLRVTYYNHGAYYVSGTWIQWLVLIVACITIVYGSAKALKEQHLKRRFAYSTISNLSYIVLALSFMSELGFTAALIHLVMHSVTKICLFFVCGEVIENSEAKYVYQLDGFAKKMPLTFIAYTLAACSITGVPLFAGFISKYYILDAGLQVGNVFGFIGVVCLIISAILTAVYSLSITFRAFVNSPNKMHEEVYNKANEKSLEMLVPIIIFSIVCVVLGVGASWFVELLTNLFI
jgi:multicomponent Na+:H+ antiporter subunit D